MDKTQDALIAHIKNSGIFKTVKPYVGEIKNAQKLTTILPAALVICLTGALKLGQTRTTFDIIVISESKVFDKEKNLSNNLSNTSALLHYCEENMVFSHEGETYCFNRDVYQANETNHPFTAETMLSDDRFTIMDVHLSVFC